MNYTLRNQSPENPTIDVRTTKARPEVARKGSIASPDNTFREAQDSSDQDTCQGQACTNRQEFLPSFQISSPIVSARWISGRLDEAPPIPFFRGLSVEESARALQSTLSNGKSVLDVSRML